MNQTNIGTLEPQAIEQLKQKHGRIYIIEVTDTDNTTYVGYFKRPPMETLSVITRLNKTDEVKAMSVLMEACFVAGADQIKTDTTLFLGAASKLGTIISAARTVIKNA